MPKPYNVFLTWSGQKARTLALFFHGWLPMALQDAQPWISEKDIELGGGWFGNIVGTLQNIRSAVVFITSENLASPWLNFEVGALACRLKKAGVLPVLLDLQPRDLPPSHPLHNIQCVRSDKDGFWRVLKVINEKVLDEPKPQNALSGTFSALWPDLERQILLLRAQVPTPDSVIDNLSNQITQAREFLAHAAKTCAELQAGLEKDAKYEEALENRSPSSEEGAEKEDDTPT